MNDKLKGSLLVVAAAVMFGTEGIAVRFAGNVDALTIAFFRCFFALVALSFVMIIASRSVELRPRGRFKFMILLGILNAVVAGFLVMSIQASTIANAILLFYTAPIFATITSKIFLKESIAKKSYMSLALCMLGIMLISGNGFQSGMLMGIVFGLIAGFSYGLTMTLGRAVKQYSGLTSTFWINVISVITLIFFTNPLTVPIDKLPLLAIMGILYSGVCVLLLMEGLRRIKTQDAGIITMLDPLTNIILAVLIFTEIPNTLTAIGGALILSAVLLQIFAKKH
jgi:drug/metabolite transporter (DMT)-like permease